MDKVISFIQPISYNDYLSFLYLLVWKRNLINVNGVGN